MSGTTSAAPAACSAPCPRRPACARSPAVPGLIAATWCRILQRGGYVGERDHQRAGARQARRRSAPRARAASPIHHLLAGGGGLAHALGIEVERDVADAFLLQQARQVLAAAAVAAERSRALRPPCRRPRSGAAAASAASIREPTKRSTSLSLYWIRNGALSIDSTMAASTGCSSASAELHAAGLGQQHEAELARLRQRQRRCAAPCPASLRTGATARRSARA